MLIFISEKLKFMLIITLEPMVKKKTMKAAQQINIIIYSYIKKTQNIV